MPVLLGNGMNDKILIGICGVGFMLAFGAAVLLLGWLLEHLTDWVEQADSEKIEELSRLKGD